MIDINSETYIEDIIELLKIIGFYEYDEKITESGIIIKEYKYHSSLLSEKHYRMITFTYHIIFTDIVKYVGNVVKVRSCIGLTHEVFEKI